MIVETDKLMVEKVNCYCFNFYCTESIFYPQTCTVTKRDFDLVMSGVAYCPACHGELLAKPLLEIKNEISKSLKVPADYLQFKELLHKKT